MKAHQNQYSYDMLPVVDEPAGNQIDNQKPATSR